MTKSFTINSLCAALFIGSLVSCGDDSKENEANLPAPVVSSYSPTDGFEGQTVIIAGENFGTSEEDVEVFFYDDTEAVVNSVTSTSISVEVPLHAYVGPITVKVKGKEDSGPDFTVLTICMIGGDLSTCPRIKPTNP